MCAMPRVTEFLLATGLRQMKGGKRQLKQKDCYILRYHEVKRVKSGSGGGSGSLSGVKLK